jgi:integrase
MMGWQRNYVVLPTGERIRYSLHKRPESPVYLVRFRSPKGGRPERSTGCGKKPAAIEEAHRIIFEEFQYSASPVDTMSWDDAKQALKEAMLADGKRLRTVYGYLETLNRVIEIFPSSGPGDITEGMAADFKTRYGRGKTISKKRVKPGEKAPMRVRRAETLDSRLRTLKAAFGWFKRLRLVGSNPFEGVVLPELDRHEVKYVRQEDVCAFFDWLGQRYPGWNMPRLFFTVKAVTGCRLEDVCSLRSVQLQDGRLVFAADQTKNRSERYAILPTDLYSELDAYKGVTYLWESYPAELVEANAAKGYPTHRQKAEFTVHRLYLWVLQMMGTYQKATGHHLSSHDFRRAAFTRAAEKDVHPKRAAVAFDVTPETMLRYYTATEKKKTADDVLSGLADDLMPQRKADE